jgi:hypothetical protein
VIGRCIFLVPEKLLEKYSASCISCSLNVLIPLLFCFEITLPCYQREMDREMDRCVLNYLCLGLSC